MAVDLDLYFCKANDELANSLSSAEFKWLNLDQISSPKRRQELLFSRYFLHEILLQNYGLGGDRFGKSPQNKPYLSESNLQISISHSQEYYGYLIQHTQSLLGLDIESKTVNDNFHKIMARYFSDSEMTWVNSQSSNSKRKNEFRRLWSFKEAFYKSQTSDTLRIVKKLEVDLANQTARVSGSRLDGCFYNVVTADFSLTAFTLLPSARLNLRAFEYRNGGLTTMAFPGVAQTVPLI